MIVKLIKIRTGKEFMEELKETYGSIDNLKRLIKKHPENALYPLDLEDWMRYMKHPDNEVETEDIIFVKDTNLKILDLELLDVIRKEHPKSIRNLSKIMEKDITTVQPKINKLAEEGFIKFEYGPKNSKIPIVTYDKIQIEI